MPRSLRRVLLGALCVVALAAPTAASAHSFLIRSDPANGARLAAAPKTMTMYFSEPFVAGSGQVTLRHFNGPAIALAKPQAHGAEISQPLPSKLRGVFVVAWRVVSDDGHLSLGEFAFAVGASGAIPTVSASSSTPWSQVAASWLVFIGVALALGGVASERFVWRGAGVPRAPVGVGVLVALIGAAAQLVLLVGDRRGGGLSTGLSATGIGDVLGARPGKLTLALLIALAVAAALLSLRRLRLLLFVPLLAAVGFTAARGHSGTAGQVWVVPADIVHLTAAALWVGALTHLVIVVARSGERGEALLGSVRRYSRFALPTVLLIAVTGVLTAIPEFRNLGAVTGSSYGRTLLIKAALIGVALLAALGSRRRALPANPHPRFALLRRLTRVEAGILISVLVVASILVNTAPPRIEAATASSVLGPPPLQEPVLRLGEFTGQLVVALAATRTELQITIVPPSDQPRESVRLTADALEPGGRAIDLYPRLCGQECFTIRYRLQPGETVVTAHVTSSVWRGGDARFVVSSPIPAAKPELLRRVIATLQTTRALRLTESVTSGPGTATQPAGYTLGGRAFLATDAFASGAVDVRPVSHRNGLTELAFALPGSNIWYRFWVDGRDRLRREHIVDQGHFIRRTFSYGGRLSGTSATPTLGGTVPPPPAGAVVFGREDGDLAVGLAVKQHGRKLELQTTVLGPDGKGASTFAARFRVQTSTGTQSAQAALCGSGCYRALVPTSGRLQSVTVDLTGGGVAPSSVSFALPAYWPAPNASTLLRRATATWRALRSLVITERLGSNLKVVLHTRYEAQAPDKLSYQIAGEGDAVIIGTRRWDRRLGQPWKESPMTATLVQPGLQWGRRQTNVHLLGSAILAGRPVWLISFYDPSFGGFFEIWVDKKSLHTLKLTLIAAGHFMHHTYSGFNRPLRIVPPK